MKLILILSGLIASTCVELPVKYKNHIFLNTQNSHEMQRDTVKKPIMVIEKTFVKPMQLLLISDTGYVPDLSKLFEKDYSELFSYIFSKGLKPGKPMAFYLNYENPMQVEVAVEVDKIPADLKGRIKSKIIQGGEAVVLHYTGTYEEMGMAYNSLSEWIKNNKMLPAGLPFEVYLNDPSSVKDKNELKTDIYQLVQ